MSPNLHVVLAPDQWRGNGPPGDLAMQIIHDRITPVPEDPDWLRVEGWRYFPGIRVRTGLWCRSGST